MQEWLNIQEHFNITYEKEVKLWREFWINKLGYYPTKIEKVVRKCTLEVKNREDEKVRAEFIKFMEQRIKN